MTGRLTCVCRCFAACLLAALAAQSIARADQLLLKDGSVLEGTVIRQDDGYWVKLADGQTRTVAATLVKEHVTTGGATATKLGHSAAFNALKRKADAVETPLEAETLWQKFVDGKPIGADATDAPLELARWRQLSEDGAEKIGGKWLGGKDRRLVVEKSDALVREASLMMKSQTLQAMKKLEEAVQVYPRNFRANFMLGYVNLISKREDDAIRAFEAGLRLAPNAPEALNNLGVALASKKEFARAAELMYKAAEVRDSRGLAQNLFNVWTALPEQERSGARLKAVGDAVKLLSAKYAINRPSPLFDLFPPGEPGPPGLPGDAGRASPDDGLAGVRSSGTGFIVRDDGLILTNRHVVEGGKSFLVLMPGPGNVRKAAEVVKVDEDQDLALLQIKSDDKLPVAELSAADNPNEGAQCFVMGYPLIDRMGATVKITQGIVSGNGRAGVGVDVVVDAKVNPGNSGGPLLDNRGRVMGIVTMKSISSQTEDSYGMAISAGRIRRFLTKNKVEIPAPANAKDAAALNAEEVAAKLKPATVCILTVK